MAPAARQKAATRSSPDTRWQRLKGGSARTDAVGGQVQAVGGSTLAERAAPKTATPAS